MQFPNGTQTPWEAAAMTDTQVREIVAYAREEKLDPVSLVFDYFREKDSRITRQECSRIVARHEAALTLIQEEAGDE